MSPYVFGKPAGSLETGQSWAKNDAVIKHGAIGELKTAEVLNGLPSHFAVFHDLRMPIRNNPANIDHAVVAGKNVILIDSKAWTGGIYWAFGERNFRGLSTVDHIAKKNMRVARVAVGGLLAGNGVIIREPVVAVWPSSAQNAPMLVNPFVPDAKVIHASTLLQHILRTIPRHTGTADFDVVNQLKRLLINP